jgi:hypothetical protein
MGEADRLAESRFTALFSLAMLGRWLRHYERVIDGACGALSGVTALMSLPSRP